MDVTLLMKSMLRSVIRFRQFLNKHFVFKPLNFLAAYFVLCFISIGLNIMHEKEIYISVIHYLGMVAPAIAMATSRRTHY